MTTAREQRLVRRNQFAADVLYDIHQAARRTEHDGVACMLLAIAQHLFDPDLSVRELLALCGYSAHASTPFRRDVGLIPSRFIADRRICIARRLVVHTAWPIGDIGESVGFRTPATFSRTFRRLVGLTPLKFRCQHVDATRLPDDFSWLARREAQASRRPFSPHS